MLDCFVRSASQSSPSHKHQKDSTSVKIGTSQLVNLHRRRTKRFGTVPLFLRSDDLAFNLYRHVPLNILTVDSNGKTSVDRKAVLNSREMTYKLGNGVKLWKLNAGATGFCTSLTFSITPLSLIRCRPCIICTRVSFKAR